MRMLRVKRKDVLIRMRRDVLVATRARLGAVMWRQEYVVERKRRIV
jgi:hypothetical protein